MSNYIQFYKSKDQWRFKIPLVGVEGVVDKEILVKYVDPLADHVFAGEYLMRTKVEVLGFGEHIAWLAVRHNNHGIISSVYMSIGERSGKATVMAESFRLPLTE